LVLMLIKVCWYASSVAVFGGFSLLSPIDSFS
jgi:hypothetical protein